MLLHCHAKGTRADPDVPRAQCGLARSPAFSRGEVLARPIDDRPLLAPRFVADASKEIFWRRCKDIDDLSILRKAKQKRLHKAGALKEQLTPAVARKCGSFGREAIAPWYRRYFWISTERWRCFISRSDRCRFYQRQNDVVGRRAQGLHMLRVRALIFG